MLTITLFRPRIIFEALHDLEDGDTCLHLKIAGHDTEHEHINIRLSLHNLTKEQIDIIRQFNEPALDDFEQRHASHFEGQL